MEDVKELEYKLKNISDLKGTLTDWLRSEINKGFDCCNADVMEKLTDSIKDLAETEEKCYKSHYYKTVVKAMENYGDEDDEESMRRHGYNPNRTAKGRFTTAGRGGKRGFHYGDLDDYDEQFEADVYDPTRHHNVRMGYNENSNHSPMNGRRGDGSGHNSEYGLSYDMYKDARRHYTESKRPEDKAEMDAHAMDHVTKMAEISREMFMEADPILKKQMKNVILSAAEDMKV